MLQPSAWLIILRAALAGWWNDRAMSLAAAISFFTVFSLAPMLLVAIAVAGLFYGREAAQGAIVAELGGMLGKPTAEMIEALIASAADVDAGIRGTVIGTVTFLVLVTGAVIELQDDLNLIWKVPPPARYGIMDFIRSRVLSFSLLLGLGFLLLVSLIVDAALSALGTWLEARFSGAALLLGLANGLVSFGIATLLFGMIFKLLPNVVLTWHDVSVGALVTSMLFTAGKMLIGWYLGASGVATGYGAAASLITILLWIYYSSLILLFGAEFTKAFTERHGSRRSARL